jgi:hypothetical protein
MINAQLAGSGTAANEVPFASEAAPAVIAFRHTM